MSRQRVRARLRNMATVKKYANMPRKELEAAADKAGLHALFVGWESSTIIRKLEALEGNENV